MPPATLIFSTMDRERRLACRRLAGLVTEQRADLQVDRRADPLLDRIRHQRRQPIGDQRKAVDHHGHDRGDGGAGPEHDARNMAPAATIGVERGAARGHRRDRRLILDLEARQRRRGATAQAQAIDGGAVGAPDRLERPGGDHRAVFDNLERRTQRRRAKRNVT